MDQYQVELQSELNAGITSSAESLDSVSEVDYVEYDELDICYGCDNEEDFCTCKKCPCCGEKDVSWVRNVHVCNSDGRPQHCLKCSQTIGTDCQCEPCKFCKQHLDNCFCPNVGRKILTSNRAWIQQLDTSPIITGWGDEFPKEVYVKIDGEKTMLFSVKKPSAIYADFKDSSKDKLSKAQAKTDTQYQRLRNSKMARRVRFFCEKKNEGTHRNVTTRADIRKMLRGLVKLPRDGSTRALSFDCEAVNLGRDGTTCYLQIQDNITRKAYLIDLLKLGQKAWNTTYQGHTLKSLFEDPQLIKLIFDVRGDSDTLFAQYGISLAGVLDVQYLALLRHEVVTLRRPRYAAAMTSSKCLNADQLKQWNKDKDYPFKGDYSVFMERPLSPALKAYSINDVLFLDILADSLLQDAPEDSLEVAMKWTRWEISWTQEADYYENHYIAADFPAARAYVIDEFADDWYQVHGKKQPLFSGVGEEYT